MADGSTRPIETIQIGDWVWATDPETGEAGPHRVIDTIEGDGEKRLVDIKIDGDVITATNHHPFWVDDQGGWIDAEHLRVSDELELADGSTITVEAVSSRVAVERVHNLTVEGIHTYHVLANDSPVLVHNCNRNPFKGPVEEPVFVADSAGNVIDLKPGEYLTGSPDSTWLQVRDVDGNFTGVRFDGGHNPATHTDPRALGPHVHVPGVTNPDGTPWLPRN